MTVAPNLITDSNTVAGGSNTATTSPAVPYPDYEDGDLLISFLMIDDDDNITPPSTGPNSETLLNSVDGDSGGTAGPAIGIISWLGTTSRTGGTQTWTISSAEGWVGYTVRVKKGSFNATTPVNSTSGIAGNSGNSSNVPTPAWTAGSAATGRIIVGMAVDADPMLSAPSGWQIFRTSDIGSVSGTIGFRDAATTSSESISSVNYTIASDSSSTVGMVINGTDGPVITACGQFSWGDEDVTITGSQFGSTQGSGIVEFWSDEAGTTQVGQTVVSWSDTEIVIDTVQGGLSSDAIVYLVITDDGGDESINFPCEEGLLPYHDAVTGFMNPDHYWRFDGDYNDTGITGPTRNFTNAVVGTWDFDQNGICMSQTDAAHMESITHRREITDSPNMNITITAAERNLSMWVQLGGVQESLAAIFKEGGAIQNLAFLVGYGNQLLAQMADTVGNPGNVQAWSDFKLAADRPYLITMRYSFNELPGEFRLYVDGVLQGQTDGNALTDETGVFNSHSGDCGIGDPDNNLETGGTDIAYAGQEDCLINCFGTWSDNATGGGARTATEIRDILFRRGALPDDDIATGTEAAMQSSVDATADTRPDYPLSYRINRVTGNGDLEITFTDKVFDARISAHVEWRGTTGETLTIVNEGTSNCDPNLCWSLTGGSITVINTVLVRVTCIDASTAANIQDARVYITAAAGGDLTVGTVILNALSNASGIVEDTAFRYTSDQPFEGKARKGTSSPYYKEAPISGTITATGVIVTTPMVSDE